MAYQTIDIKERSTTINNVHHKSSIGRKTSIGDQPKHYTSENPSIVHLHKGDD